jgi:hypothetical protein
MSWASTQIAPPDGVKFTVLSKSPGYSRLMNVHPNGCNGWSHSGLRLLLRENRRLSDVHPTQVLHSIGTSLNQDCVVTMGVQEAPMVQHYMAIFTPRTEGGWHAVLPDFPGISVDAPGVEAARAELVRQVMASKVKGTFVKAATMADVRSSARMDIEWRTAVICMMPLPIADLRQQSDGLASFNGAQGGSRAEAGKSSQVCAEPRMITANALNIAESCADARNTLGASGFLPPLS